LLVYSSLRVLIRSHSSLRARKLFTSPYMV